MQNGMIEFERESAPDAWKKIKLYRPAVSLFTISGNNVPYSLTSKKSL